MASRSQNSLSHSALVVAAIGSAGLSGYFIGKGRDSSSWISDISAPTMPRGEYALDLCREEIRRALDDEDLSDLEGAISHMCIAVNQFHFLQANERQLVRNELADLVEKYLPTLKEILIADPVRIELFESYELLVSDFAAKIDSEIYSAMAHEYLRRATISSDNLEINAMLIELDEAQRCGTIGNINVEAESQSIRQSAFDRDPKFKQQYLAIERDLRELGELKRKDPSEQESKCLEYLDRALRKELYGDTYFYSDYLRVALKSYLKLSPDDKAAIHSVLARVAARGEAKITNMLSQPGIAPSTTFTDLLRCISEFKEQRP